MRTFWLKAGRRVRKNGAVINLQFVTRACAAMDDPGKVFAGLGDKRISVVVRHYRKLFGLRRPNAKMRFVFAYNFRSYRITPLHSGAFSSDHYAMVVYDLASPVTFVRIK